MSMPQNKLLKENCNRSKNPMFFISSCLQAKPVPVCFCKIIKKEKREPVLILASFKVFCVNLIINIL